MVVPSVCLIGKLISSFEKGIRKVNFPNRKGELAGGLVEVILICVIYITGSGICFVFSVYSSSGLGCAFGNLLVLSVACYQIIA